MVASYELQKVRDEDGFACAGYADDGHAHKALRYLLHRGAEALGGVVFTVAVIKSDRILCVYRLLFCCCYVVAICCSLFFFFFAVVLFVLCGADSNIEGGAVVLFVGFCSSFIAGGCRG